ncbi:MAG: DtxR family transcriptional regulator [Anaerolineae bacterium]
MSGPLVALAAAAILAIAAMWPRHGLVARWSASRESRDRTRVEDALKHLLHAESRGGAADIESLAGCLGDSPDVAAAVAAELSDRGLIKLRNRQFQLTPTGREYALQVLRAHRLWERYLADETGYDESEWHARAEHMEHTLTPGDADDLAARLGHPTHDPHGDPIPTTDGYFAPHKGVPVIEAPVDTALRIVHIEDEPDAVYAQLVAERLSAGMTARATEISPSRVVLYTEFGEHVLAPIVAANVFTVPVAEPEAEDAGTLRLSDLDLGQRSEVVSISLACRATERRRLLDLGVVPGTVIDVEFRSPGGDPTAYTIRGATIALRASQADHIRVRPVARDAA